MVDDDVEAPVVVEVTDGQPAPLVCAGEVRAAARSGDVEVAVARVAKEHWGLSDAGARRVAHDVAVDHDEVFPAVVVEVDKSGAEADVKLADRRGAGELAAELPVAPPVPFQAAVESVDLALEIGDPDRGPAAALVIRGVNAHAAIGRPPAVAGDAELQAEFTQPRHRRPAFI